jgi:hypothetical protein
MVLIKIALVGIAVIAILAVSKQQHWFERVGVTGRCTLVAAPSGETGEWWRCRQGVLTGFPNLPEDQCTTDGYAGDDQLWQCTIPLKSAPGY